MSARIYIEGGGDSKELHSRCREGFRRLLEKCGFSGRMPRLVACGSRSKAFEDFCTAHRTAGVGAYVAMLVDSEDPVADNERPWDHLNRRDGWNQPEGAVDAQALLMVVCMEAWIAADRSALRSYFGQHLQESALPPLEELEQRDRNSIQNALAHATRGCGNTYAKGKCSFEIVGKLSPEVLRPLLPAFARMERILAEKLPPPF